MNIALTTQETLGLMKESLAKNVTIQTGLTAFDLQAPAKNLYPTITPLRNSIARVARLNPGDAAHWRSIFATAGSGFDAMGWVPEGQRSASMSYAATPVTLPYVTLGEEDTVTRSITVTSPAVAAAAARIAGAMPEAVRAVGKTPEDLRRLVAGEIGKVQA